jgi:hypothetical protein
MGSKEGDIPSHRKRRGKKLKTIAGTLVVLFVLFCRSLAAGNPPGFFPFEPDEEMRSLISQATALALIHNLALTPDQRKEIKRNLEPVQAELQEVQKEEMKFRDDRIKPRLRQVIQELKAGRDPAATPSEQVVTEMTAFRTRMAGLFMKTRQAFQGITALLTPAQQERLRDFRFEEYLGPMPPLPPGRLLGMEPGELLREIRSASPGEIEGMVEQMERRRERMTDRAENGKRAERMDRKVRQFADLARQIQSMPQEEFDARQEQLTQELNALSPPRPGPDGRGDPRPPTRPPPFGEKGFDTKRIVFSKAFYEAL